MLMSQPFSQLILLLLLLYFSLWAESPLVLTASSPPQTPSQLFLEHVDLLAGQRVESFWVLLISGSDGIELGHQLAANVGL